MPDHSSDDTRDSCPSKSAGLDHDRDQSGPRKKRKEGPPSPIQIHLHPTPHSSDEEKMQVDNPPVVVITDVGHEDIAVLDTIGKPDTKTVSQPHSVQIKEKQDKSAPPADTDVDEKMNQEDKSTDLSIVSKEDKLHVPNSQSKEEVKPHDDGNLASDVTVANNASTAEPQSTDATQLNNSSSDQVPPDGTVTSYDEPKPKTNEPNTCYVKPHIAALDVLFTESSSGTLPHSVLGLSKYEYIADQLKAGELDVAKCSDELRKTVFGVIKKQLAGDAKTLVLTGKKTKPLLASQSSKPDDEHQTRPAMRWSAPSLRLSFSRRAALKSIAAGRGFGFAANESFTLAPTKEFEPSIFSLIATRPAISSAVGLHVELTDLEGSGSLSDGYRGLLRIPGESGSRKVIVKITCPTAFEETNHPRFSFATAKGQVFNEAKMYCTSLACLQQDVVPIFYGLWEVRTIITTINLRRENGPILGRFYAEVLEDVGSPILMLSSFRRLSQDQKLRVIELYDKVHRETIVHDGIKLVHIRKRKETGALRLIDFEKSWDDDAHTTPWNCRSEWLALCEELCLSSSEADKIVRKIRASTGEVGKTF